MDAEAKEKWVTALRSGEYEQGRSSLRDATDRYCCLGVLADLIKNDEQMPWTKATTASDIYCLNGYSGYIPDELAEGVGLSEPQQEELVDLNDNERYDFHGIADWIEENL